MDELKSGGWIFSRIQPLFHSSLQKRCRVSENQVLTTLQLTLLAYLNISLIFNPSAKEKIFISPSDFAKTSDFDFLISKVYPEGSPKSFSKSEYLLISETVHFLKQKSPPLYSIFNDVFLAFCRVESGRFCGASHPHAFGMYFAGNRFFSLEVEERAVSLVHELAHQELFLIQLIDRLVEAEADYRMAHAPYQNSLRPPIGRLHSLAALARMISFCDLIGKDNEQLKQKFQENFNSFADGDLTEYGHLVASSYVVQTANL